MKLHTLICAALWATLCGCFNSSSYIPIVTGVSAAIGAPSAPNQVTTGTAAVIVGGEFFTPDTVVSWGGKAQATTYQSPASVSVTLETGLTNIAGKAQISATNDGNYFSAPQTVTIVDADLTVTGISPLQAPLGASAITLTVTGTGLRADTQILWNSTPLAVTFVSSTSVTVQVPAALLAVAGDQFIQVVRPPCLSGSIVCGEPQPLLVIFSVGAETATRSVIQRGASDLVWDATHSMFYGAVAAESSGPSNGVVVAPIDPASGTVGTGISVANSGATLQISAGDQFLYVESLFNQPFRATLPGLTSSLLLGFAFGSGPVAPSPDAPATFAFGGFETGLIDGSTLRPDVDTSLASRGLGAIAWGGDSTVFYAFSSFEPGLLVFNVTQSGVSKGNTLTSAVFRESSSQLVFDLTTHRFYGNAGDNFDEQGGDSRPFTLGGEAPFFTACPMAIDGALGKAFFACTENKSVTIRSFDLQTQQLISRVVLTTSTDFPQAPSRVVRWKDNGLAVATGSSIYLYSGPFVH